MSRIKKDVIHQDTRAVIDGNARQAAHLLVDHFKGVKKKLSITRLRAAIFIVEQAVGKAPQRLDLRHSGELTYKQVSEKASDVMQEAEAILSGKQGEQIIEEAKEKKE